MYLGTRDFSRARGAFDRNRTRKASITLARVGRVEGVAILLIPSRDKHHTCDNQHSKQHEEHATENTQPKYQPSLEALLEWKKKSTFSHNLLLLQLLNLNIKTLYLSI